MKAGVVFDKRTGKIVRQVEVPRGADLRGQAGSNEEVVSHDARLGKALFREHYVDVSADRQRVVPRKTIAPQVATATGEVTLSNLPDPVVIEWNGQSTEATGGQATLTFDEPGEYTLRLSAEPKYVARDLTVTIP